MSTAPAPLRDQIIAFLRQHEEATAKEIISATSEATRPSRVMNELNKLRTDAAVECAKKKGKNELWYWLVSPAAVAIGGNSQPAVEQNTGSSVAGATTPPADAAVQHQARTGARRPSLGGTGAADVKPKRTRNTTAAPRDGATTAKPSDDFLLRVIGGIRDAIGDPYGRVMLEDLPEHVRARIVMLQAEPQALRAALSNQNALVDKLEHLLQSSRNEAEHLRRQLGATDADMVNHPPHYQGAIECIDAIHAALGAEGFAAFCRGNALKYTFRAGKKGPAEQDLAKAGWYLARISAPNESSTPAA